MSVTASTTCVTSKASRRCQKRAESALWGARWRCGRSLPRSFRCSRISFATLLWFQILLLLPTLKSFLPTGYVVATSRWHRREVPAPFTNGKSELFMHCCRLWSGHIDVGGADLQQAFLSKRLQVHAAQYCFRGYFLLQNISAYDTRCRCCSTT